MKFNTNRFQIAIRSITIGLVFIVFTILFSSLTYAAPLDPNDGAQLTARCDSVATKQNDACVKYVLALYECDATDTECQTKAYNSYVKGVCGADMKCANNNMVISKQTLPVATTPKTGEVYPTTDTYDIKDNPMIKWVVTAVNLLATIIIIGASAMLIIGGIQYITSADNPQRVQAAKDRIRNVIIGVVAFFFLYVFLQWLIPGGVL